jgi:hypothetical protein
MINIEGEAFRHAGIRQIFGPYVMQTNVWFVWGDNISMDIKPTTSASQRPSHAKEMTPVKPS